MGHPVYSNTSKQEPSLKKKSILSNFGTLTWQKWCLLDLGSSLVPIRINQNVKIHATVKNGYISVCMKNGQFWLDFFAIMNKYLHTQIYIVL